MHDVALNVHQDVTVVPIFDLKDVADQRVGCKRAAEVFLSFLELY